MTSPKIDDAMIERAWRAQYSGDPPQMTPRHAEWTRKILEAALSPPEEPEIPVTDAMKAAGYDAFLSLDPSRRSAKEGALLTAIYRAMEKARRKEAERQPVNPMECQPHTWLHRRSTDGPNVIFGETHRVHRRKDDP